MNQLIDEVSVLRDTFWLGLQNTDFHPSSSSQELELAEKLRASGLLKISTAGKILNEKCYRLTDKAYQLAGQCYSVVEAERDELRVRIISQLSGNIKGKK